MAAVKSYVIKALSVEGYTYSGGDDAVDTSDVDTSTVFLVVNENGKILAQRDDRLAAVIEAGKITLAKLVELDKEESENG